jgi:hypothetical protein
MHLRFRSQTSDADRCVYAYAHVFSAQPFYFVRNIRSFTRSHVVSAPPFCKMASPTPFDAFMKSSATGCTQLIQQQILEVTRLGKMDATPDQVKEIPAKVKRSSSASSAPHVMDPHVVKANGYSTADVAYYKAEAALAKNSNMPWSRRGPPPPHAGGPKKWKSGTWRQPNESGKSGGWQLRAGKNMAERNAKYGRSAKAKAKAAKAKGASKSNIMAASTSHPPHPPPRPSAPPVPAPSTSRVPRPPLSWMPAPKRPSSSSSSAPTRPRPSCSPSPWRAPQDPRKQPNRFQDLHGVSLS